MMDETLASVVFVGLCVLAAGSIFWTMLHFVTQVMSF